MKTLIRPNSALVKVDTKGSLNGVSTQPGAAALTRIPNVANSTAIDLVKEMIAAFEKASLRPVPYRIGPRRPGDVASCYADASLAQRELGWSAALGVDAMCRDAWRWQSGNPEGYKS